MSNSPLLREFTVYKHNSASSVVSGCLQPHGLLPPRLLRPGFSRQEDWRGLPCPSPGEPPDPGINSRLPALQADSLPFEPHRLPWGLAFSFSMTPGTGLVVLSAAGCSAVDGSDGRGQGTWVSCELSASGMFSAPSSVSVLPL